ncbi:DUF3224 domain-containing protein [Deefgea tanakiae]|uniref:DUF3224 domain-containing protein n=1 Tax=Deefgea tanakiae TaxID=2865840 RepID=A0ABX8Z7Q9_9NEIS|nr:DUF3224 domain-containing protein [Deefgea tanakiae]QZA78596.1 DUF3224 domain-containing protein [Deefgea tanakiae]
MSLSSQIKCNFIAQNWAEIPFHEMEGAGKLSRASITNTLSGDFVGEGILEYLLSYPNAAGDVTFIGYERIVGAVGELKGTFTVEHHGLFSPTMGVSGALTIVAGSGTGDFSGITGNGQITAIAGEHGGIYTLNLAQ